MAWTRTLFGVAGTSTVRAALIGSTLDLTGEITVATGDTSLPSVHFVGDTNTGIFRPAADAIGLVTNAVERARIDNNQLTAPDGNTATPGLAFRSDVDTGFYLQAAGVLGIVTAGEEQLRVSSSGLTVNKVATGLLNVVTAAVTINNSATETTLYSYSVAGGTLSTNRALRLTILGETLTNNNATTDLTVRAKYGATAFGSSQIVDFPQGAGRRPIRIAVELFARGATNAQSGVLTVTLGRSAGVAGDNNAVSVSSVVDVIPPIVSGHTGIAIDSTAAANLVVTAQFDAAGGTSTEFVMRTAYLEVLR